MTNNGHISPSEVDIKLNHFGKAQIENEQMMNTAISNILGNIELLMTAYDPTSSEYNNLKTIRDEMEMLGRELI